MKKIIAFVLALVCILSFVGCNKQKSTGNITTPNSDTYMVMEVKESVLLVAEIGEDGKAVESKQYSVPNEFHSSNIAVGDKIKIEHNGEILETFPMQFARIHSMEYIDTGTGLATTVIID